MVFFSVANTIKRLSECFSLLQTNLLVSLLRTFKENICLLVNINSVIHVKDFLGAFAQMFFQLHFLALVTMADIIKVFLIIFLPYNLKTRKLLYFLKVTSTSDYNRKYQLIFY